MPLPWYMGTLINVMHTPMLPIYGYILPLESMRGTFLSGTSLALFIDIPTNPTASAGRELDTLRGFLAIMKTILESIPPQLLYLAGPWIDYYHATETFCEIARQLHLQMQGLDKLPKNCHVGWPIGSPTNTSP